MKTYYLKLLACVFVILTASTALPAPADDAFREGRAAYRAGDFERARQHFAKSQELDPAAGTLLNLAFAEEKLSLLVDAWGHVTAALKQFPPGDDRGPLARRLHDTIDRRLPRVVLEVAANAGPRLEVALDGQPIEAAQFNRAIPLDPGKHVLVVGAGGAPRQIPFTVVEGEVRRMSLTGAASGSVGTPPEEAPDTTSPPDTTMATWGYGLMGVGAAGLVLGGVMTALVVDRGNKVQTIDDECGGPCTDSAQRDERNSLASAGVTFSAVATVSAIAGLAAVGGGLALLIYAPSDEPTDDGAIMLLPQLNGGTLRVRF